MATTYAKSLHLLVWDCPMCTYKNTGTNICAICDAWKCGRCTTVNYQTIAKCASCDLKKPGAADAFKYGRHSDQQSFEPYIPKPQQRSAPAGKPDQTPVRLTPEKLFHCECSTSAFCGEHLRLTIFQEFPTRLTSGYPENIDDLRYIVSSLGTIDVFPLINGPGVVKYLSKTSVQSINGTRLTICEKYLITTILISKSRFGIEVLGPSQDTIQNLLDHVFLTGRPICIEVQLSDDTDKRKSAIGSYISHGIVLAITPPKKPKKLTGTTSSAEQKDTSLCGKQPIGQVHLIDPNSCSKLAQYDSFDIEQALMSIFPKDPRFEFVPQAFWLGDRSFDINGAYEDLGVSSGWCRTISIIIAGMIMRQDNPIAPENILPCLGKCSRELRIMMFDATVRHIVAYCLTVSQCAKILEKRDEMARKHQAEIAAKK